MRRLGLIGTFVYDTIWHPSAVGGRPLEQWGGAAYSLSGLAAACPAGASIVPICRIGSDLADSALDFLSRLPNLTDRPGIEIVSEPNNRVELRYATGAERTERLTGGVPSWSWASLKPHLEELDALYVNFLSGYEIDLDVAERLETLGIPVYADLHSLFLGAPGGVARQPRRLPHWKRWLRCFGAVQMNEVEFGLLGPARGDVLSLLPRIHEYGPALTVITRGREGASYAVTPSGDQPSGWTSRAGWGGGGIGTPDGVRLGDVPTGVNEIEGDPTGCGDVWGSVFFAGLCGGVQLERAMRRAHVAAAAKMMETRIEGVATSVGAALDRFDAS